MASETGREARDGYSLVSYDDGTFGWETDGGRSRAGYRSKGAASTQGKRARAAEVADLASADPGHAQVDTMLEEIQQRVSSEYLRAYEEAQAKLDDYLRRFEAKDRTHAEAVRRGEETEADYREWRRGQILMGNRWQEMVDTLAEDYRNADRVAASIVNGYAPDAYALNHDYATFQVEKGSNLDTSYTLYSRATVERLLRDQPDLLPRAKVDGKKDLAWNRKHIASAITQGVLQGEDLRQVSKRMRSVADMDERAAMRTARTAMTSAQNAGRLDAYRRSAAMGIDVRKRWRSTLDGHTRHSHRRLDDEVAGLDEAFSNGLMYPGDPSGAGREVYNCRCTVVPYLPDYPADRMERASRLGDMSYEQWRGDRPRGSDVIESAPSITVNRDNFGSMVDSMSIGSLEQMGSKQVSRLSDDVVEAIRAYTDGPDYLEINEDLRSGAYESGDSDWRISRYIGGIDEAMASSASTMDLYLTRRVAGSDAIESILAEVGRDAAKRDPSLLVGRAVVDRGYVSTSASTTAIDPEEFGADLDMSIHAPEGTRGVYVAGLSEAPEQMEFLLDRDTQFVITDAWYEVTDEEWGEGTWHLWMEAVQGR